MCPVFAGLQSGHLLSSIRPSCRLCAAETVDTGHVPEELLAHGIQVRIMSGLTSYF